MELQTPLQKSLATAAAIIAVTVVYQSIRIPVTPPPGPPRAPVTPCVGEPIVVDYGFYGGYIDPHACKVQCTEGGTRYIQYNNGKATQCETPPGCNDWGEDNGVECAPVLESMINESELDLDLDLSE